MRNGRPLLDNGFGGHVFPWQRVAKHVDYCEIDMRSRDNGYADYNRRIRVLLDWVFCLRFARSYKRIPDQTNWVSRKGSWSAAGIESATVEGKVLVVQEETERALGSHWLWAVISDYNYA
jgi:hypothetical protein